MLLDEVFFQKAINWGGNQIQEILFTNSRKFGHGCKFFLHLHRIWFIFSARWAATCQISKIFGSVHFVMDRLLLGRRRKEVWFICFNRTFFCELLLCIMCTDIIGSPRKQEHWKGGVLMWYEGGDEWSFGCSFGQPRQTSALWTPRLCCFTLICLLLFKSSSTMFFLRFTQNFCNF